MKRYFVFWAVLFSLTSAALSAENAMSVKARAWPKTVTMGDEIRVFIQVTRLQGFSVQLPEPTNLAPFELKSVRELPSAEEKGIVQENFELVLTVFKVGDFKIPPMQVLTKDRSGDTGSLSTPPIDIKVVGVIHDQGKDIKPIKNVISLAPGLLRTIILGSLVLVLCLILVVRVVLLRNKKIAVDPESRLPAHERAFLELGRLERKDWLAAGKLKEYYSELSSILKRYLERRYQVRTSDLTTSEIIVLLRKKDFEFSVRGGIQEILEASDLVKFANWVPPKDLSGQLVKKISDVIEQTKLVPVPEEKKA